MYIVIFYSVWLRTQDVSNFYHQRTHVILLLGLYSFVVLLPTIVVTALKSRSRPMNIQLGL